jgi:hypothetical protein
MNKSEIMHGLNAKCGINIAGLSTSLIYGRPWPSCSLKSSTPPKLHRCSPARSLQNSEPPSIAAMLAATCCHGAGYLHLHLDYDS